MALSSSHNAHLTASKSLSHYRVRAIFVLTLICLVIFPPFMIYSFYIGNVFFGMEALLVVLVFATQAWFIYRRRPVERFTSFVAAPCVIFFLITAVATQKLIGIMWCFPGIVGFYFMLPRLHAVVATIMLLVSVVPLVFLLVELELATRIAATLICSGCFAATFVLLIERQQQELHRKELQRREAMANVSHELRTPLSTLMGQIEAMADGIRPLDTKGLNSLSQDVTYISAMVDDLFLLSQSDVEAIDYQLQNTSLDNLVADSVNAAQFVLNSRKLVVNITGSAIAVADPQRLRQVVDNLLQNCGRYTQCGGRVYITLRERGNNAILRVADNGPGVSDEDLPMLFDRFYRVEKSRARKAGGTGLGLALVKALITGQQGTVQAYHAEQGGLGVEVVLPKA